MTDITLHCPLCSGALQIDDSLLGQQVQCPLCQGLLQLPPPELAGGPQPEGEPPPSFDFSSGPSFTFGEVPSGLGPPPGMPSFDFPGSPPPVGPSEFGPSEFGPPAFPPLPQHPPARGGEFDWNAPISLGCPVCGLPFQITAALAGQTVSCPHCSQPVQLPPWEAFQPAPAPPANIPMGTAAPLGSPVPEVPPSATAPLGTAVPPAPAYPPDLGLPPTSPETFNLPPAMPPTASAPMPAATTDTFRQKRTVTGKGDAERPTARAPETPPRDTAASVREREKTKHRRRDPAPADLLPPGAGAMLSPGAAANLADLLPPGADLLPPSTGASEPADLGEFNHSPQSAADVILPPSAGGDGGTLLPGMEQALPDAPRAPVPKAAAGTVVLPTADGKYVTVREQGKIVGRGDDEVELKRLSSDEKASRRIIRNLILGTICIGLIALVMYVMIRVGPRPGKKSAAAGAVSRVFHNGT